MDTSGAIVVILNEKDEMLVLKRPHFVKWAPNQWGLPGGKIEPGESSLEAAVREVKEETTLDVEDLRLGEAVLKEPVTVYYTRKYAGTVELDFEHTDFKWAGPSELSDLDLAPGIFNMYNWVIKNG